MLARPRPAALASRPDFTCRSTQESPQTTAITIARPTIVRTRLAPPVPPAGLLVVLVRCSALCSLLALAITPAAEASAGTSSSPGASSAQPSASMATLTVARVGVIDLGIEGDSEESRPGHRRERRRL